MELSYDHYCFGCGERNPQGLQLKFSKEGEKVVTHFIPQEFHQGYPGIMHGGITSTLLDEAMSTCLHTLDLVGVTARLEVRFRKNIPINSPLQIEARITKSRKTLVDTEGRILFADGEIAAEAKGRFMIIDADHDIHVSKN